MFLVSIDRSLKVILPPMKRAPSVAHTPRNLPNKRLSGPPKWVPVIQNRVLTRCEFLEVVLENWNPFWRPAEALISLFLGVCATDGARFIGSSITFKYLSIDTKKHPPWSRDKVPLITNALFSHTGTISCMKKS